MPLGSQEGQAREAQVTSCDSGTVVLIASTHTEATELDLDFRLHTFRPEASRQDTVYTTYEALSYHQIIWCVVDTAT